MLKLGSFLYANGNNANSNSEFLFPKINLDEEGLYNIKFYILLNCDDSLDCSKYSDFININLIFGTTQDQEINEKYDFKNIGGTRKWIQKSFNFYSITTQLSV